MNGLRGQITNFYFYKPPIVKLSNEHFCGDVSRNCVKNDILAVFLLVASSIFLYRFFPQGNSQFRIGCAILMPKVNAIKLDAANHSQNLTITLIKRR